MIRGKSVRKTSRGGSAGRRRGTGDSGGGGGGGVSKREAARRQMVAAQKQAMKAAWLSGKTDLQARRAAIQVRTERHNTQQGDKVTKNQAHLMYFLHTAEYTLAWRTAITSQCICSCILRHSRQHWRHWQQGGATHATKVQHTTATTQ